MINYKQQHLFDVNCINHLHPMCEFVCVYKGQLSVYINNEEIIINEGQGIFIPSYFIHRFKTNKKSETFIVEFLPIEELKEEIVIFNIPTSQLDIILNHLNSETKYSKNAIAYIMHSFCFNDKSRYINKKSNELKTKILKYISENYQKPLTLKLISEEFHINYSYMSRNFKKSVIMSFSDCLNSLRVKNSEVMLLETDDSISKIAMDCGFGSIRNYNRVFLDKIGVTPKEYRKINKK